MWLVQTYSTKLEVALEARNILLHSVLPRLAMSALRATNLAVRDVHVALDNREQKVESVLECSLRAKAIDFTKIVFVLNDLYEMLMTVPVTACELYFMNGDSFSAQVLVAFYCVLNRFHRDHRVTLPGQFFIAPLLFPLFFLFFNSLLYLLQSFLGFLCVALLAVLALRVFCVCIL